MIRVNETIVGPGGEELKAGKTYELTAEQEKHLIINRRAVAVLKEDSAAQAAKIEALKIEATEKWNANTDKKFREKFPTVESFIEKYLEGKK